ncbi:uncharacterized protein LOC131939404 [Physella acuta]|uniref:uncharacterized protein LOC131939404 n=1 Tax=Physella acuta TaxID=109671 RepID=UPI0027DC8207|nr:uncharacterized protein LOC131939404 [Physella acuta]
MGTMETTIFLFTHVLIFVIPGILSCPPAEEGMSYDLKYSTVNLKKETTMVMWTKDDILVAECPVLNGECVINDVYWLSARVEQINDMLTFHIHIHNVSRRIPTNPAGVWKLRTHTSSPNVEVFYHCSLQVYAKPKDVFCDFVWSIDTLDITCSVTRIYPEAMMIVNKTNTHFGPISCTNTKLNEEPVYYKANCNTQFLHQQLHVVADYFNFFIYPNIIAASINMQSGVNTTASLHAEPAYVVLKECSLREKRINCSCRGLDKGVSIVDNYIHNNRIDYTNKDVFNNQYATEEEMSCKPTRYSINGESRIYCDNSAVIVLALVCVVMTITTLILFFFYTNRCRLLRDMVFMLRKTNYRDIHQNPIGESAFDFSLVAIDTSEKEDFTACLLNQETTQQSLTAKMYPNLLEGASAQSMKPKIVDKIHLMTTSSVLLIGTRNSNKDLLKRSMLQREYCLEKTETKKTIVDLKTKKDLFEIGRNWKLVFNQIKLPDEEKIQLHFTKYDNHVIKLVDGPVYDTNNINTFIEDMKACITLSNEEFKAIIVAFTNDRANDCNSVIKILHDSFGFDVNNVISVIIYETELKIGKEIKTDYATVKSVCGERMLMYDIENHTEEVKSLISLVSQMEYNSNNQLLRIKTQRSLQYGESEKILQNICLLLETVLDESQNLHGKNKELVDHLENVWNKYHEYYEKGDKLTADSNHTLKMDKSVIEDVTHLIECFRNIYSVAEPMRRSKEILMPSFKTSYQNFHDWYVMSVIKDKENLLDSNLKMRLSKVVSK